MSKSQNTVQLPKSQNWLVLNFYKKNRPNDKYHDQSWKSQNFATWYWLKCELYSGHSPIIKTFLHYLDFYKRVMYRSMKTNLNSGNTDLNIYKSMLISKLTTKIYSSLCEAVSRPAVQKNYFLFVVLASCKTYSDSFVS